MASVGSKKEAIISEKLIMKSPEHIWTWENRMSWFVPFYDIWVFGNTQTAIGTRESDL